MKLSLAFDASDIKSLADEYLKESRGYDDRICSLADRMRKFRYLTKPDFVELGRWKSPRPTRLHQQNSAALVEEATHVALTTECEEMRIMAPQILKGVSWPVASVILHFGYDDQYPILDFRALESLGVTESVDYSFSLWWDYTLFCRELASKNNVNMRTLDRALWQHSKKKSRQ